MKINSLFKSLVGYLWGKDDNWKDNLKPVNYVVAKNGVFEVRKNKIGTFYGKTDNIEGVDLLLEDGVELDLPLVPYKLYLHALAFLRAVYDRDQTEATIHLFFNEDKGEYFLWVPKQRNGSASSDYERDEDPEFTQLCQDNIWVMAIHSHPTFAGNPSGIDDRDEQSAMLYMVVGHITTESPDVTLRTFVGGKHVELDFYDVWEDPIQSFEVPKEWLDKCTKKEYKASPVSKGKSYGYGYGYGTQGSYFKNNFGYYDNYDGYGGYDDYWKDDLIGFDEDYSYLDESLNEDLDSYLDKEAGLANKFSAKQIELEEKRRKAK